MIKVFQVAVLFLFTSLNTVAFANISLFEDKSHCVAYKTTKKMFMVRSVEVIGKNCDISSQILPDVGGVYYIEVKIPIASFSSNESERDRDVMKLLKAAEHPEMVFKSKPLKKAEWMALVQKKTFTVTGTLSIGEEEFLVEADSQLKKTDSGYEVDGLIKSTMDHFKIKPPKLAVGLAAKVSNDLELHFHLLGQKTLGVQSILN